MAATSDAASAGPWASRTSAVSVARLTLASTTPGTLANAFSTRMTHEAQVMPSMRRRTVRSPAAGVTEVGGVMESAVAGMAWGRGDGSEKRDSVDLDIMARSS